jgi:BirA family biotin operon repressor/biotin-[acetyl-CoA-carboxylase] ligase
MRTIGSHIIRLDTTESTNLYAESLAEGREIPDGTVIVANHQTAGRGQGSNTWVSEPGKNLTITIVLHPRFLPADRQFQLNKAVSLGVYDLLEELVPDIRIKWPNDIYAGDRKIGGILIQHQVSGNTLETTFAGIGLNLNQTDFPPDLPNPSSVKALTGRDTDPEEALKELLEALEDRYRQLQGESPSKLDGEYYQTLRGAGVWNQYQVGDRVIRGRILGVDAYGRLMLEEEDGNIAPFTHGKIEYL